MNRKVIVMTMMLVIGSAILGLAAAETNQRILPHTPVVIELNPEDAKSLLHVETLKITSLGTIKFDITQQFPTQFPINYVSQEEFRQGDIMGIMLNYTYSYSRNPQGAGIWESSNLGEKDGEYVYLDEVLFAYFKISLALYDSQGILVANTSDLGGFCGVEGLTTTTNVSSVFSYRGYCILVSYDWVPGIYTLKASVKELLSGLVDSSETIVNITVGPPPAVPYPISIHPRLVMIGSEDLPEGWVVAGEDLNRTTLEGFGMSVRSFTKPDNGFAKDITIEIIQFVNDEVAAQYLESRMEGMLLTEKYGHCRVTMQEIGDSGFLVDQFERRDLSWSGWDDWTGLASGSFVVFREHNLVVMIYGTYRFEAIKQGVYVTNEELIEFAGIQAAKISMIADVGE